MGKTQNTKKSKKTRTPPSANAIARARRVRGLRDALRYSREEFSQKYAKYKLTADALQSWEAIRWCGLTEEGAQKLVTSFQDEGLNVTVEWLMYGISNGGPDPLEQATKIGLAKLLPGHQLNRLEEPAATYTGAIKQPATPTKTIFSAKENILHELKLFHELNPGCIDAVITDDGLAPWLAPGDHVAGPRYFGQDMERAINHPCIIQTLDGRNLIRILKPGRDLELYSLNCTNPDTSAADLIVEDIKLFSAAPIIWIRKQQFSK